RGHEQAATFVRQLAPDSERRSSPKVLASAQEAVDVVEFSTKITDVGISYVTWAWKITLRNNTTATRHVVATIQFLDKEGFELENTLKGTDVGGGEKITFTGSHLINAEI